MNLAIIASIVAVVTLIMGIGIALILVTLSNQVDRGRAAAELEKSRFRPASTQGLMIPVEADTDEQLKAAKKIAARNAALTPRGANMRIGKFGPNDQPTAFDNPAQDPLSAVRIAEFHGWDLWRLGGAKGAAAASAPAEAVAAPAPTAAPSPDDLTPGKDYPVIEITDAMSPEDVRKARVANAKAKSAAVKALKEAGEAAGAPAAPAAGAATAAVAPPTGVAREPQPGADYQEIPITDAMSPDEVRRARIANAKAKSAAAKAMRETDEAAAAATPPGPTPAAAAEPSPAPASAAPGAASATVASIPRPEYVDITADLSPDEVRRARIANAKAKSAYQKALKEAGFDPATVED